MTQCQRNPAHDTQIFPAATITDMLQNGQQENVAQIIALLAKGNVDNEYYVMRSRPGETKRVATRDERCVYTDMYYTVFQKKPVPTPLDIPWHIVAPEWVCAAMDDSKKVWFYTAVPSKDAVGQWCFYEGRMCYSPLNICTEGINWENSLTFRPKGQ